ncbi:MAG: glycosyl hydrolase-related protein, partial [Omnitrophica WOR_2 bacterium]
PDEHFAAPSGIRVYEDSDTVSLERGGLRVAVDRARGVICQITSPQFPQGALPEGFCLADVWMRRNGQVERFTTTQVSLEGMPLTPRIVIRRSGREDARLTVTVGVAPEMDAVDIIFQASDLPRPDPGIAGALTTGMGVNLPEPYFIHDHPFGVSEIRASGKYLRKYPTGDWMTSPQLFETVENPFTALQFLDMTDEERGLLFLHNGSQAFLRRGDQAWQILSMYDPWDEDYFVTDLEARLRVVPHGALTHAGRWRLAQEFTRPVWVISCGQRIKYLPPVCSDDGGNLPPAFRGVSCDSPGVVITAFYREMEDTGKDVQDYAGAGMEYPYILRLVELDGEPQAVSLALPGKTRQAYKTNLLGAIQEELPVSYQERPDRHESISRLDVSLRSHEIATLYLDLELGRKVYRDLDAERQVWATVHRVDEKVQE